MAEQRYQAVLAVISEGRTVTEAAGRWGVSRQTVHAWLARYEARVLELRRVRRSWGARRIVFELGRLGIDPVASESGVYWALVPRPRHRWRERAGRRIRWLAASRRDHEQARTAGLTIAAAGAGPRARGCHRHGNRHPVARGVHPTGRNPLAATVRHRLSQGAGGCGS